MLASRRTGCGHGKSRAALALFRYIRDSRLKLGGYDGCVIEYEVHGTILATGAKYSNRFCSIIKIENRKIVHWRDYMDSLAGNERTSDGIEAGPATLLDSAQISSEVHMSSQTPEEIQAQVTRASLPQALCSNLKQRPRHAYHATPPRHHSHAA